MTETFTSEKPTFRYASLEIALQQWGLEYGAGRVQWLGYPRESTISKAALYGGRVNVPSAIPSRDLTQGDIIENIVRKLEGSHWREMMVLRIDFCAPTKWAMDVRLGKLKKVGIDVSRRTYYRLLDDAKAAVNTALYERNER